MIDLRKRPNLVTGLTVQDYQQGAALIKCEVASIRAVDDVESAGSGFLPSGRPKILFEGHYFYRLLRPYGKAAQVASEYPTICYPAWTSKFYLGGEREYSRLELALKVCAKYNIPEDVALKSASWGRFQIMGNNHNLCGYQSVVSFVNDNFLSEKNHLKMFCTYLINTFLDDELRARDWTRFAFGYNGAGYKRNRYDEKMAVAYKKYKAAESKTITKPITTPTIINTPITVPDFKDDVTVINVNPDNINSDINKDDKSAQPSIEISLLTTIGAKFNQFKTTIATILAGLGISGGAGFSLNFISNPLFQYAAVGVLLISLIFAGIYMIMWLNHRYALHKEKNQALKEYNLEQLKIRANPSMYNVEFKP